MVKNDAGGNKGKGLARKHVNAAKCGGSKQLRVATDEAEKYAVVSKMLGNGMCYVRLLSGGGGGGDKLCIIRNKFKGRGKRDNILDSGSWVLVGLREWSSKQDTCDLLEVYNDGERDRLMKNEPCFKGVANESNGNNNGGNNNGGNNNGGNNNGGNNNGGNSSSSVQFADSNTLKYSKLVADKPDQDDDGDGDGDGDGLVQQRVYDMPSSSDSGSGSDSEDESDESLEAQVPVQVQKPAAALNAPKHKVNHINVDDI